MLTRIVRVTSSTSIASRLITFDLYDDPRLRMLKFMNCVPPLSYEHAHQAKFLSKEPITMMIHHFILSLCELIIIILLLLQACKLKSVSLIRLAAVAIAMLCSRPAESSINQVIHHSVHAVISKGFRASYL